MYLNVYVRQFRAETTKLPKLPHIHVQIHCNANEKSYLWKRLLTCHLELKDHLQISETSKLEQKSCQHKQKYTIDP